VPDLPLSLWVAAAVALVFLAFFLVAWRRDRALPRIVPREARNPDCMVVIPARNEEAVIARAVRSLPPDSVIVVDDHSEDGTAEAARQAGAGVIPAPPLPRNGIGKANACAAGVRPLTSRWVLFADADACFEPGFLSAAVATAESGGYSLLSIHLDPEYGTFAERVLVPYARALVFCGAGPRNSPGALFTGHCLLALREPYNFFGTHAAVVTYVAEDVKLTALAQRHRLKLAIARAPGLGRRREYDGFRGIRSGMERHAFRFMLVKPWIGVAILLAASCAALWLPVLAWLGWDRQWIAAAVFAVLPIAILRPWYESWKLAFFAPIAFYWLLPVLARGLFSAVFGRAIVWKGRTVRAVS
jgi:glycosyltransferase involved in cell wall biosynthesis